MGIDSHFQQRFDPMSEKLKCRSELSFPLMRYWSKNLSSISGILISRLEPFFEKRLRHVDKPQAPLFYKSVSERKAQLS
jgi:hypothetical protein